jgi:hypothetical protein
VLCKKIRSKFAILKKFATRTPVSTKRTNRVASKNHTSGRDKKNFLSDLISTGLRGKHTEKSDQNSKKIFSVLAGLRDNLEHENTYRKTEKERKQVTTTFLKPPMACGFTPLLTAKQRSEVDTEEN